MSLPDQKNNFPYRGFSTKISDEIISAASVYMYKKYSLFAKLYHSLSSPYTRSQWCGAIDERVHIIVESKHICRAVHTRTIYKVKLVKR